MKKFFSVITFIIVALTVNAQDTSSVKGYSSSLNFNIQRRASDHLMLQYGYTGWATEPDSVKPSGFSRHFNFYVMIDKPFKKDPHYSIAFGGGLGTENMFFKGKYVDLKASSPRLPFDTGSNVNFHKFKVTTFYFDIPVELRYAANPANPNKGFKAAIGVKGGLLLKAYNKGKDQQNEDGRSLYGSNYIRKEYSNRFINSTRFAATARIGFGNLTASGSYQITTFLKNGAGPDIRPYSIGITLSGL